MWLMAVSAGLQAFTTLHLFHFQTFDLHRTFSVVCPLCFRLWILSLCAFWLSALPMAVTSSLPSDSLTQASIIFSNCSFYGAPRWYFHVRIRPYGSSPTLQVFFLRMLIRILCFSRRRWWGGKISTGSESRSETMVLTAPNWISSLLTAWTWANKCLAFSCLFLSFAVSITGRGWRLAEVCTRYIE